MTRSSQFRAAVVTAILVAAAYGQQSSVSLNGKPFSVEPSAAKGRIGGSAPVAVGQLHAGADIVFKGAPVPKGDYSLYVTAAGDKWQLIINKAKAGSYDPKLDVGRVAMVVANAPAPAAAPKVTVNKVAALAAKIEVASEDTVATAQFRLDRVAGDSEW